VAEPSSRGRFVWHELVTPNPAAAIAFYPAITGWTVQPFADNPSYKMWSAGQTMIGGVMDLPGGPSAPPHWLPYVGVDDVDDSVRQAVGLGANVQVPAQDIPNVGRFAILIDPQGAAIALFRSSGRPPGHEGPAELGEFSWHELATSNGAAAFEFYKKLFGWEHMSSFDMGPMGQYRMFGRRGLMLGGIYDRGPTVPASPWLSYVLVPNVDSAVATATARGATLVSGPMDVSGGDRVAQLRDPQGVVFAVHMVAAAPAVQAKRAPAGVPERASAAKSKGKTAAKPKRKAAAPAKKASASRSTRKTAPRRKSAAKSKRKAPAKRGAKRAPRPAKKRPVARRKRRA